MNKGLKIVLSGPSGSGKGTIVKELIKDEQFLLSISATTRSPRQGEEEGVHYFFKTREAFEGMIAQNELLEYAEFCGNYYGTPKAFIEDSVKNGKDVILEIEVEGAMQIKKIYPEAVFIFVVPPSLTELESRLVGRNTEAREVIEQRLARAKEELALYTQYDYVVVNDRLVEAIDEIKCIVRAEKLKSSFYGQQIEEVIQN
ncbi:MAG: guanylate kinase [Cellulosilyticum sp.]|nr:guanylate kinase [Cellulosilyticum sp.]